jgi:predicted DNA-binding transcriptional regulator YafY
MPEGGSSRSRAGRLEVLKVLLAERDYTTAAELADELGLSVRTVHRDLAFLRDLGMPVGSDRGRGGGLRLEHGWSLGRVHLSEAEAIGLLLSLAIAEKIGSPLLLDDVRSIARKIGASFPPAQARRVLAVRRRILVGASASTVVLASYTPPSRRVAKPLLEAFAGRRLTRISYQDQHAWLTVREVEIQYLYYNVPVWYALAWDRLRDDVRSFRLDRIKTVQLLSGTFALRREDEFRAAGEPDARAL